MSIRQRHLLTSLGVDEFLNYFFSFCRQEVGEMGMELYLYTFNVETNTAIGMTLQGIALILKVHCHSLQFPGIADIPVNITIHPPLRLFVIASHGDTFLQERFCTYSSQQGIAECGSRLYTMITHFDVCEPRHPRPELLLIRHQMWRKLLHALEYHTLNSLLPSQLHDFIPTLGSQWKRLEIFYLAHPQARA